MSYDPTEALKKYENKMYFLKLRYQMPKIIEKAHFNANKSLAPVLYVMNSIRPLLDGFYVAREKRECYMAYSHSLYKSQRTLTFMVDLIREHQILRNRWEKRGLDPDILDLIDLRLIIHKA